VSGGAYVSEEGGPYQPLNASSPAAGAAQEGEPLSSVACGGTPAGLSGLFGQTPAAQGSGSALGLQDLGPATIGGQQAEHYQGTINLGSELQDPQVMQALSPLLPGCGGANGQASAFLPLVLAGLSMSIDAYVDPATNVPLQLNLDLSLPLLGADLSVSGQMTPLASPVPIAVPAS
jgi:hypothetical protein